MKRSAKYSEELGGDRVVPESPFEVDVLRRAILADTWTLPIEQHENCRNDLLIAATGGYAVFEPEWSANHFVHYLVGEHRDDGFFDLSVAIHPIRPSHDATRPADEIQALRSVAEFSLLAALVFQAMPPFQTGWLGPRCTVWTCPKWFLRGDGAAKRMQLKKGDLSQGPLILDARARKTPEREYLPPHVLLVDPSTLGTDSVAE